MATPQAHHIQGAKNSSRPPVWVAATCMGGKLEPRDSESNPGTAVTWDVGTPARPHSHHAPSPPSPKCKHDGDTHTARGYLFRAGAPPHEPSPPRGPQGPALLGTLGLAWKGMHLKHGAAPTAQCALTQCTLHQRLLVPSHTPSPAHQGAVLWVQWDGTPTSRSLWAEPGGGVL